MSRKKILIFGDSFAADWTIKHSGKGWPNFLADEFEVSNFAQAGSCEYRIYQNIVKKLELFESADLVVIWHTSPYRIYVKSHPVHANNILHANSDLIYEDILHHSQQNKNLQVIVDWFEQYYDLEQAEFVHGLICDKIQKIVEPYASKVLHASVIDYPHAQIFKNLMCFDKLFETNKGILNHFDDRANWQIFETIKHRLG